MRKFKALEFDGPVFSILENISFLGGLTEVNRKLVFRFFETASFAAGEFVARKGEKPTHIYIIRKGVIGLVLENEASSVSKRVFVEGDSFGEAALLSLVNNSASFRADQDTDVIALSRKSLNELRKVDSDVFTQLILNIARDLARKLQYTDEMLLRL